MTRFRFGLCAAPHGKARSGEEQGVTTMPALARESRRKARIRLGGFLDGTGVVFPPDARQCRSCEVRRPVKETNCECVEAGRVERRRFRTDMQGKKGPPCAASRKAHRTGRRQSVRAVRALQGRSGARIVAEPGGPRPSARRDTRRTLQQRKQAPRRVRSAEFRRGQTVQQGAGMGRWQ